MVGFTQLFWISCYGVFQLAGFTIEAERQVEPQSEQLDLAVVVTIFLNEAGDVAATITPEQRWKCIRCH
ncbi:hypothetical protein D3C79_999540 [compost metagenome]